MAAFSSSLKQAAAAGLMAVVLATAAAVTGDGTATARWQADEAWTLQVLARLEAGEVLYRDVFYGVTPLSLYLLQAIEPLSGITAWAPRVSNGLVFGASIAMLAWLLARLNVGWRIAWVMLAAAMVWLRPIPSSTYVPLASMLLFGVLIATLQRRWMLCAILAALAFATKQTVGVLAVLYVLPFLWREDREGSPRRLAQCAGVFLVTVAACLAPVWLSGGAEGLWEYGFAAKGNYAQNASVWPDYAQLMPRASWDWLKHWPVACTLFAAIAPLLARLLRPGDAVASRLGWFAFLGLAALGPRYYISNLSQIVLFTVPAAAYLLARVKWPWRPVPIPSLVLAPVAVGSLAMAIGVYAVPLAEIARGELVAGRSLSPHYAGIYLPATQVIAVRSSAAALRASGRPVFFESSYAGLLYLVSGRRNPTPYDYPLSSAFGRHGERRLTGMLDGEPSACLWLDDSLPPGLEPVRLLAYAETQLTGVRALPGGALHCRPDSPEIAQRH